MFLVLQETICRAHRGSIQKKLTTNGESSDSPYPMNNPQKIIVHHTLVGGNGYQFKGVNNSHKQRNFKISSLGFYVGYQWFIEKDGTLIQARLETELGQHTTGENLSSIGICFAGNFDIELPTAAQITTYTKLVDEIFSRYPLIPRTAIFPHRMYANKSCYGNLLDDAWGRETYKKYKLNIIQKMLEKLMELLRSFKK